MWSINARREREGDPSSSQSLPAAAACLAACFSFPPSSQWKFKPKPTKNTSWTCERELRSWMKVEQLLRGKERVLEWVGRNWQKKREPREEEEGGNGRKREGKHYQTVQTYLELKGMGHVVSFSPLVFET